MTQRTQSTLARGAKYAEAWPWYRQIGWALLLTVFSPVIAAMMLKRKFGRKQK